MKSRFPGFSPDALAFLRELKENNDREWFTPRKSVYEELVRLPMIELVRAVHAEMLSFAPNYVGEAAKCVFRVYRDTRFSKDKTPYKTNIAATFHRNGLEKSGAGLYLAISPEEGIDVGGGMYWPEPETLSAVRRLISENCEEFRKTFETPKVKKLMGELKGDSVTRAPKGFDPEDPALEFIKRKQFLLMTNLDAELATTPKLLPEIVKRFEVIAPLADFLNRPLTGPR